MLIALIILLIIAGAGLGVTAYYTDGFRHWDDIVRPPAPSGLTLKVNGEELTADGILPLADELRVDVSGTDVFEVDIIPTTGVTFDFRKSGALVKFPYLDGDIGAAFGLTVGEDWFSFNSGNRSMTSILEKLYPGETITEVPELDTEAAYFLLRVSGGGKNVEIPLTGFIAWIAIEVNPPEIIF